MSIGIDNKIDTLKASFNSTLKAKFAANNTYAAFGRAYKNRKTNQTIPEVYLSDGQDYKEKLYNDSTHGHSFFIVQNDYTSQGGSFVDVSVDIYFAVDLSALYPLVTERATEYLHRDVVSVIQDSEFEFEGITSGFDAFSEFSFVRDKDNMHPRYLCKFSTKINVELINEC